MGLHNDGLKLQIGYVDGINKAIEEIKFLVEAKNN